MKSKLNNQIKELNKTNNVELKLFDKVQEVACGRLKNHLNLAHILFSPVTLFSQKGSLTYMSCHLHYC